MGFAADALRQQQWMSPGITFDPSGPGSFSGHYKFGAGATPPLSTPSTATYSSSSSAAGAYSGGPLTPDTNNFGNFTTCTGGLDKKKTGRVNKIQKAPALPPVCRLSTWPDFSRHSSILGSSDARNDNTSDDLDSAPAAEKLRDDSAVIVSTIAIDSNNLDTFLDSEESSLAPASEYATFFSSSRSSTVSGETSTRTTAVAKTPTSAELRAEGMVGPTYMAVSARPPLSAREYQRYRSRRRGGDLSPATPVPEDATGADREREAPSGSEAHVDGPAAVNGVAANGGTTSPREGKRYREPSCSSPEFMTRQEFEALPPAIQRKYFSTLEALRLTQTKPSNVTIPSSQAANEFYDFSSTSLKPRKGRRAPIGSDHSANHSGPRPLHRSRTFSADSTFKGRPARGQRSSPHLNRPAARNKSLSIVIDTADGTDTSEPEEIASLAETRDDATSPGCSVPPSRTPISMETPRSNITGQESQGTLPTSFFDSFKFLEDVDVDDLDRRLQLDSFDENSQPEARPKRPKHKQSPSFRKHLSISKINLSRSSQPPPSRLDAKDRSATPTSPPPSLSSPIHTGHGRRKSRALSLRGGRPSVSDSIATAAAAASIDLGAAHYQDPEARLKLRVYLASPQKFDEAIEFGFPSADVTPARRTNEPRPHREQQSHPTLSDEPDKTHTFLADDKSSIYSDDVSMPEPDSPKTPEPLDNAPSRPFSTVSDAETAKPQRDFISTQASSREMTLRMTLTRPDLRARDDQIYGWQGGPSTGRHSPLEGLSEEASSPGVVYIRDGGNSKDSIERQFAEMDQWASPERGVVKRFWNRVRRQ
ncbi:uncharacterized protein DNG_00525 [Cephalotrichum gorgonifer]|uniref:Uncharacterized protein n=1 Tax=Cephalotrichum gorgonifer TaxID=2041049 RepID=A0AAE8MQ44_9PEZI|nr:uncharacterized protein DNG_00525 [Cephalotrichum gorgonifer]